MSEHSLENVKVEPQFDMELFMSVAQSNRIDGATMELADTTWAEWLPLLKACKITVRKAQYLLVWLDEAVEKAIETAWDEAPSQAFDKTNVAQAMLMGAIREILPDVAANKCAPVPKPYDGLMDAMSEAGVDWTAETTLSRQYAMITHYPYKGGCGVCYLSKTCPNAHLG